MKIISKQHNSRMCVICGLDNPFGVKAQFYTMADGSCATKFHFQQTHQSYPGRVHGGLITSMLDEMGLRAMWAKQGAENDYCVTMSLESSFRRPVPYNEDLIARGIALRDSRKFTEARAFIFDSSGLLLANGIIRSLKLTSEQICGDDISVHEEMPYLIKDDLSDLDLPDLPPLPGLRG